jgi:hypothetical protein
MPMLQTRAFFTGESRESILKKINDHIKKSGSGQIVEEDGDSITYDTADLTICGDIVEVEAA